MSSDLKEFCLKKLKELEAGGLLRKLREIENGNARFMEWRGEKLLNFSSNDYLGLASRSFPRKNARNSPDPNHRKLSGATASRLISGNHASYSLLEKKLVSFKKVEDVLVFTSGYAAAVGTIPSLVGSDDFIVMDKLCHASLIDGARLSGATLRVFPHNHLKRCGELLSLCRKKGGSQTKILLITESVFSMDGDLAPLGELVELKNKHGAWLMVDEAHAMGVLGKNGRGGAEYFGVEKEIDISMGTLSKAVGCVGGFMGGSRELKQWLINRSRSLIFSTGLPPGVCETAVDSLDQIMEKPEIRADLWRNVKTVEDAFSERYGKGSLLSHVSSGGFRSPIIPLILGDEKRCVEFGDQLLEEGVFVPAIRYPTVPRGKARLRISLSALHQKEDLLRLVSALDASFKR